MRCSATAGSTAHIAELGRLLQDGLGTDKQQTGWLPDARDYQGWLRRPAYIGTCD
jgi:hypothetical protein